jgi:hypothetical protein
MTMYQYSTKHCYCSHGGRTHWDSCRLHSIGNKEHQPLQPGVQIEFGTRMTTNRQSQWPRGLRHRSTAARLLRSGVRIPSGAWMFCLLCVVKWRSRRRNDHSSRGVLPTVARRCVWSRNLVKRGGHSPCWTAEPEKIITIITNHQGSNKYFILCILTSFWS